MINFSDGVRHLYLPGINQISIGSKITLNEWLKEGKDYFIAQNLGNNDFSIITFDIESFLKPFVFDINRLSCAALESINDVNEDAISPKFLGWTITKYYYSAFFSAHSILKLTGNSLSNIETNSLNKIRELSRSRGFTYGTLNGGLYSTTINSSNYTFRFYKDSIYDDSHKGLWLKFLHFIRGIQSGIYLQLPLSNAQLVIDKLEELDNALTNWSSIQGQWLSRIRNQVNYGQNYGLWYPYDGYKKEFENIAKYQSLSKENPLTIDLKSFRGKDVLYFVRTCQLINAINFDMQRDLLERHPNNKSFLLQGVFAYHKKYLRACLNFN